MNSTPLYGYFAGALFSNKDICGNALLANSIFEQSGGDLLPILPQNLEQIELRGAAIRNTDLYALARADWALFQFDGTELDSGTVVEHEFAKFLDIPTLLLRTDFRTGGDAADLPWNLMNRPGPRGSCLILNAMELYQDSLNVAKKKSALGSKGAIALLRSSIAATELMHRSVADLVIERLRELITLTPILDASELRAALLNCSKTAGDQLEICLNTEQIELIVSRRFSVCLKGGRSECQK